MEFDRDNLPASIDVAEKAIHQRLRGLPIARSKRSRRAIREMALLKRLQPVSQQASWASGASRSMKIASAHKSLISRVRDPPFLLQVSARRMSRNCQVNREH